MEKQEAVKYLMLEGISATLDSGVVMIDIPAAGSGRNKEYRRIVNKMRAAGYNASIGIKGGAG